MPLDRGGPVAPIDPRIRARRIEVQRRAGRRRLQRLLEAGLVATVALAFAGALWTPLLDVDRVEVAGTAHLDAAAVARASGIEPGEPLVRVDLRSAGERIAALSWVQQVRLDRRLDGTVHVAVTEREPVARAGGAVVDAEGRVLAPTPEVPGAAALPALDGLDQVAAPGGYLPDRAADALLLAASLATAAPGTVASLEVTELVGTLAQGGTVRFGDATGLEAKIRSLHTVLEQVDLTCLAQIDLRLPGSPVLTRESGCS